MADTIDLGVGSRSEDRGCGYLPAAVAGRSIGGLEDGKLYYVIEGSSAGAGDSLPPRLRMLLRGTTINLLSGGDGDERTVLAVAGM